MMDQEKENRELALEGGDSDNSDEEQSGHRRNTNGGGGGLFGGGKQNMRSSQQKNVTSEYFANGNGNWNRGGNENGPTGMGGNNQGRVQSRGRMQITAPQKGSSSSGMGSNAMHGAGSQSHLMMPGSAGDSSVQKKNNKAMAQLAPLDYAPNASNALGAGPSSGVSSLNIPSLESLQNQNKLQPLNHIPSMSKKTPSNRKY